MAAPIINLPTAAVSYYTVGRHGREWVVYLVTPVPGLKPIRTALYSSPERDDAILLGKQAAERALRPFREGRP